MSVIDLDAVALAAADQVAAKMLEALPAIIAAELDRREQDRFMDAAALAKYLGKSTAALSMWLRADRGGAELAAIAVAVGGRRSWRKSEVDLLLAQKQPRAVGDDR